MAPVSDDIHDKPIKGECNSEEILEINPDDGAYRVPLVQKIPLPRAGVAEEDTELTLLSTSMLRFRRTSGA